MMSLSLKGAAGGNFVQRCFSFLASLGVRLKHLLSRPVNAPTPVIEKSPIGKEPSNPSISLSLNECPWFELALADKDVLKEVPGEGDNPVIVEMLRKAKITTPMLHDQTAWCGAYVYSKLLEAGLSPKQLPLTPAWAASWLHWGQATDFRYGCIVVVPSKAAKSGHHVTFGYRIGVDGVWCIGGNQANSVNKTLYPLKGAMFRWPIKI